MAGTQLERKDACRIISIAFKKIIKELRDAKATEPEHALEILEKHMAMVKMVLDVSEGKKKKKKGGKKRKAGAEPSDDASASKKSA